MHPWSGSVRAFARLLALAVLALVATPIACSDGNSGPADPGAVTNVDGYLSDLPSWFDFSPQLASSNEISGTGTGSVERAGDVTYECLTTPYTITETPDKIVTLDPDANILWLGALLQGDGYREGLGSLKEWTVRERAPLTLSIDLLSGNNTRTVERPDLASVTQAIGELISAATAAGHSGGSSVSFAQENTYSVQQGLLSLGISAGYASVSVKASLSASRTAAERTVTAYFVQRMFTVSAVLPNSPGDFFSPDFTAARLQEEVDRGRVGPDALPVYVANIVYGRILMFSFTSTANITDIRAALAASFSSIAGAEIEARYLNILNAAQISVVTLGGEGRNATAIIQSGQLKEYFNEQPALTSARPISYTVRNLGDNSIAKVSETSDYNLKECTAIPATGSLSIDVAPNDATVLVSGPNNYTFGPSNGDQSLTTLAPGGYSIKVTREGYDSVMVDTTVEVGATTTVTAALELIGDGATGAEYRLALKRLLMQDVSCSGEGEADVYYSMRVNGQVIQTRARDASVGMSAGQWVTLNGVFTGTVRDDLVLVVDVLDADGFASADEPMGSKTVTWTFPSIPTGPNLAVTINNIGGCSMRLEFEITKGASVFDLRALPGS